MIKVLAACGNGMGSSLVIKMKIEQVLKEMGVDYDIHHSSVGQAKSDVNNFDLVLVSQQLVKEFNPGPNTKVIGLVNLLSADEIREKVSAVLDEVK